MHHGAIHFKDLMAHSPNNEDIELKIIQQFSKHQAIYSENTTYLEYESILLHSHQQEEKSCIIALFSYSTPLTPWKQYSHSCADCRRSPSVV